MTATNAAAAPATPAAVRAPGKQFGSLHEILAAIPSVQGNDFAREGARDAGRSIVMVAADAWGNQPAFSGYHDERAGEYEGKSLSYIIGSILGGLASNFTTSLSFADAAAEKMAAHMQGEEHDRQGVAGFADKGEMLMERAMLADARSAFVGHLLQGAAEAYEETIGEAWKPYVRPGAATGKAAEVHATSAKERMAAFLAARKGG